MPVIFIVVKTVLEIVIAILIVRVPVIAMITVIEIIFNLHMQLLSPPCSILSG